MDSKNLIWFRRFYLYYLLFKNKFKNLLFFEITSISKSIKRVITCKKYSITIILLQIVLSWPLYKNISWRQYEPPNVHFFNLIQIIMRMDDVTNQCYERFYINLRDSILFLFYYTSS